MIVCEIMETMKNPVTVEFRNSKNAFICTTKSDSEGVDPYRARNVLKWFLRSGKICILLEDEKLESWFSDWTEDCEM